MNLSLHDAYSEIRIPQGRSQLTFIIRKSRNIYEMLAKNLSLRKKLAYTCSVLTSASLVFLCTIYYDPSATVTQKTIENVDVVIGKLFNVKKINKRLLPKNLFNTSMQAYHNYSVFEMFMFPI